MWRTLRCVLVVLGLLVASLASAIDLYIVAEPPSGGGVYPDSPVPLSGLTNGQVVNVVAAPSPGYRFDQWVNAGQATIGSRTSGVTTITLMGSPYVTVAARFVSTTPMYSLTVTNDGNGTTSPSGTSSNLVVGRVVTISAEPYVSNAVAYTFDQWMPSAGIADPRARSTSVAVDNNKTITAFFRRLWHLTVIDPAGPGSGRYTTNMVSGALIVIGVPGTMVSTTTNFRYRCTGWTDGSGAIPLSGWKSDFVFFAMTNCSIRWTWVRQYPVTIVSGPGGTTSPVPGARWEDEGSDVTVTAVAAAGYRFVSWTTGTNVTTVTSQILTVNAPVTAVAVFARKVTLGANGVPEP